MLVDRGCWFWLKHHPGGSGAYYVPGIMHGEPIGNIKILETADETQAGEHDGLPRDVVGLKCRPFTTITITPLLIQVWCSGT